MCGLWIVNVLICKEKKKLDHKSVGVWTFPMVIYTVIVYKKNKLSRSFMVVAGDSTIGVPFMCTKKYVYTF